MKSIMHSGKDLEDLTFAQLKKEKETVARLAVKSSKYIKNLDAIRELIQKRIAEREEGP